MWYTDGTKWKAEAYSQALDDVVSAYSDEDGANVDADGGGLVTAQGALGARIHGNPYFDTANLFWNDNTEQKRAEVPFYEQEYAHNESTQAKRFIELVPGATEHIQGSFYIIDVDDPELVEGGEHHMHRQLAGHYAEITKDPMESWPPWVRDHIWPYMAELFFTDIANGHVPPAILMEPIRQHFGLPYEWLGARVEDERHSPSAGTVSPTPD